MCASAPWPTLPMPRGVRTASMMNASAICESPGFVLRISFVDDGTALRCVETDRTALRIRHVGVPAHRTERPFQTSAHAGTTLCLVEAVGLSLQIAIGLREAITLMQVVAPGRTEIGRASCRERVGQYE